MDPEKLEALRRNSGLAVDKDGVWTWGGKPVENSRVQALYHRGLEVRDDGEVTLGVGHMWAYVAAASAARFVRAVNGDRLRLLGEREAELTGDVVAGWGPDERLYLWIPGLKGPTICLREAHQALAARIEETPDGLAIARAAEKSGDVTDDRNVPLVVLASIPTAAADPPVVQARDGSRAPRA